MKNLPEKHRLRVSENRVLKGDEVVESEENCIITSLIICIV
jgi:hypothetical protein